MPNGTPSGADIVSLGQKHVGEKYVLGVLVPKNNAGWKGPWDCSEFASWLVYQVAGELYGCESDSGNPATVGRIHRILGTGRKKPRGGRAP